jgi:hypothetical protein
MDLLIVAQLLVRRRIALALGAVLAVAIGALVSGILPGLRQTAKPTTSGAVASVLVDTPRSLTGSAEARGADTIIARTASLADMLTDDQARADVARTAGVPVSQVAMFGPSDGPPPVVDELAERATVASATTAAKYTILLSSGGATSILHISVGAPEPRVAARLAAATVAELQQRTAAPRIKGTGVKVEPLGATRMLELGGGGGSHRRLAVIAVVMFCAFWCASVVIVSGLVRLWRSLGASAPQAIA